MLRGAPENCGNRSRYNKRSHQCGRLRFGSLAATATYNNPVDDLSDPTAPRRIALAIGESQGLVLADSMLNATFAPYDRNHWYFEHDELVIVDGDRLKRWRFDLTSGQPSRVP